MMDAKKTKKTVKIKYVDFWTGFEFIHDPIYNSLLRCGYTVQFEKNEPDYIIYSVFGQEHLKYDCIRIFYTGEDESPDFNICDYGIGFDNLTFGDRYFRLPLFYHPMYADDFCRMINRQDQITRNREFCSCLISNSYGAPERGEFLDLLSAYKKVDSGGKFKNNVGGPVKNKLEFERQHKFSLCFENASHPGYITEKIMQAFAAGCIPIYWGAPDIEETFNARAFVNAHRYKTLQQAVDFVKKIDQDDTLYQQILNQPALTDPFCSKEYVYDQFDRFICNIFEQDLVNAQRVTRQARNRNYTNRLRRLEKHGQKLKPALKLVASVKSLGEKLVSILCRSTKKTSAKR